MFAEREKLQPPLQKPKTQISATSVSDAGDTLVHVRFSSSDVAGTRCQDDGGDTQVKAGGESCLRLKREWHRLAVPSLLTEKVIPQSPRGSSATCSCLGMWLKLSESSLCYYEDGIES